MDIDVLPHSSKGVFPLLLGIKAPVIVATDPGLVVGQCIKRETLAAHLLLIQRPTKARKNRIPVAVMVIHRNMPLGDGDFFRQRNHKRLRKHLMRDPNMHLRVAEMAQRSEL